MNPSVQNHGGKVIIAPKLLKPTGGMSQLGGNGSSSSILNLPVLGGIGGDNNMPLTTNRGLKGMDSSKQLYKHEESKIQQNFGDMTPGHGGMNPSFYSRSGNQNEPPNGYTPLSPAKTQNKQEMPDSSRNMSVLNMKKSSARFLSPIGAQKTTDLSTVPN